MANIRAVYYRLRSTLLSCGGGKEWKERWGRERKKKKERKVKKKNQGKRADVMIVWVSVSDSGVTLEACRDEALWVAASVHNCCRETTGDTQLLRTHYTHNYSLHTVHTLYLLVLWQGSQWLNSEDTKWLTDVPETKLRCSKHPHCNTYSNVSCSFLILITVKPCWSCKNVSWYSGCLTINKVNTRNITSSERHAWNSEWEIALSYRTWAEQSLVRT